MKTPVPPDSRSAVVNAVNISHLLFFGSESWWVPFSNSYIVLGLGEIFPGASLYGISQ
jgi:hypothetical protein